MMKKLTPEQEQKRNARREAGRALARAISKMDAAQRLSLAGRMSVTTIEGRTLSLFNQCMIARQNPSATLVGGFRQWLKHGRCVEKGQSGMIIWIPIGIAKPDAEPNGEAGELRFILGNVFDVTQTREIETALTELEVAA